MDYTSLHDLEVRAFVFHNICRRSDRCSIADRAQFRPQRVNDTHCNIEIGYVLGINIAFGEWILRG